MAVVAAESAASGNVPHESRIHFLHRGEWGYTDFGYNPHSTEGRYWVDLDNPVTGSRERHQFPTLDAYHAWVEHLTGIPREHLEAPLAAARTAYVGWRSRRRGRPDRRPHPTRSCCCTAPRRPTSRA